MKDVKRWTGPVVRAPAAGDPTAMNSQSRRLEVTTELNQRGWTSTGEIYNLITENTEVLHNHNRKPKLLIEDSDAITIKHQHQSRHTLITHMVLL